jgi:hypothetical protein
METGAGCRVAFLDQGLSVLAFFFAQRDDIFLHPESSRCPSRGSMARILRITNPKNRP